jgi:lipopolysaccharide/colanic/teichoic acid biosynthesis glycosyltransferase
MDSLKSMTFPNKGKRNSVIKKSVFSILRFLFLVLLIIVLLPVYLILSLLVLLFSGYPVFYSQYRIGMNGKKFKIYKFRTMVDKAEKDQQKLKHLNEADGPVFKIRNDPRLTGIGKFLSHSGLDELPQLFNVLKGDMCLVGPRPLPVDEAKKIKVKYRIKRESVKPGMLSPWILNGYHRLSFDDWMESDISYIENKSFPYDLKIFFESFLFSIDLFFKTIKETLRA